MPVRLHTLGTKGVKKMETFNHEEGFYPGETIIEYRKRTNSPSPMSPEGKAFYKFRDGETVQEYRKRTNQPSPLETVKKQRPRKYKRKTIKARIERKAIQKKKASVKGRKLRRDYKEIVIEYKKECQICGEGDFRVLVFHHINKADKLFSPSQPAQRSEKAIINEIKKCLVLCLNCHKKVHFNHVIDKDHWEFGEDIRLSPVKVV